MLIAELQNLPSDHIVMARILCVQSNASPRSNAPGPFTDSAGQKPLQGHMPPAVACRTKWTQCCHSRCLLCKSLPSTSMASGRKMRRLLRRRYIKTRAASHLAGVCDVPRAAASASICSSCVAMYVTAADCAGVLHALGHCISLCWHLRCSVYGDDVIWWWWRLLLCIVAWRLVCFCFSFTAVCTDIQHTIDFVHCQ